MSLLIDTLSEQVYGWMLLHSDSDGFVNCSALKLALSFKSNRSTVLKAMRKLEHDGRAFMICKGNGERSGGPRWVVVEKAM